MKMLVWLLLFFLVGCTSTPIQEETPPLTPISSNALSFVKEAGVLLAHTIELRLHPDLEGQVTYSIDKNFHEVDEKRGEAHKLLTLSNTSNLPLKPVKFFVGKVLFAATHKIQILFHAGHEGVDAKARGKVVWKWKGKELRSTSLHLQDGKVVSTSGKFSSP